ncbi:MAG: flagellar basal-body MS-ring/collar protein FliF [Gammaproteobacteria bacterium]|nr:flagellar basal-body MS-ring/collar protein FliF [Gammaproteobacteria bacterium]
MEGDISIQQSPEMPDKAMRITKTIVSSVSTLFGLAAVLALSVAVIMWASKPEYSPVIDNLSDSDIGAVTSILSANEIPYKVDSNSGSLLVANDQKQKARILLSAEGLPNSSPMGYELLKQDTALGTSQFLETARYQHALETELSRSISSMRNIDSARVHLAMPKRTAFMRKKDKSSASVMVNVSGGLKLEKGQINSIAYLVASSVPYLNVSNVTVVDQWGNLLNSTGADKGIEHSKKQFDYKMEVESLYVDRIESMLAPIFGYGRVKVQVNAEMDFTRIESTQELFDSDQEKVRSEQIIDQQQTGAGGTAIGIPGALSNQPPAGGTVDPQGNAVDGSNITPTNSNRNSVRNYELDKTIRHVMQPVGELQKITVAVVADDWVTVNESGEEVRTELSDEDFALIRGIVSEAIGFSEERGDSVSVYNKSFQTIELEVIPELPIWKQDWFVTLVKQSLAGIAILILIFTVVKPTMKTLQGRLIDSGSDSNKQLLALENSDGSSSGKAESNTQQSLTNRHPNYVEQLAMAKQLVGQDSKQVAKVVKNWVSDNG